MNRGMYRPMNDVTPQMLSYRECVRHVWNTHFRAEDEARQDWDLRDRFCDAALILFRALVLHGLDVDDSQLLADYRGDRQPLMFLRLEVDSRSTIMVNRTGTSGYWDDPVTAIERGDCDLRFIQFFDWWDLGFRDFAFYRVRIVASPRHPHLVGRDALVPVTSSVKIFCDIAASHGSGAGNDLGGSRDVPDADRRADEAASLRGRETIENARAAAAHGDFASAIALLRPLAEAGNREAQYELGFLALTECESISGREAFSLFTKAAQAGHVEAMYHLATFPAFIAEPFRSPLSDEETWQWLMRAAEGGSVQAQRDAGASLATGDWREGRVPRDLPAAVAWYRRAADAGHPVAQYNLASMLAEGEGCDRDVSAAREWLRRAVAGGYEYAQGLLAHLDALQRRFDGRSSDE